MTNSQVSLREAASTLLSRREAAQSLLKFTEHTNPVYETAEHHRQICEKLEAVERGEIDRLMIFMPPRHGKSELASRRFPAWYIGKNPHKQIITASYGAELATDFGRDVRNIVSSPEYGNVFDTGLREDSRAANRWNTSDGGSYVAVGVGGPITGRGAHIALIDDPFKDRQDADSQTIRERVWAWYKSTLYTRLMPGGAIVLIQTRWHEDDLAGKLLAEQERGGDQWEVLSLKAEDNGEALWPQWYPIEALNRIKAAISPREWHALYQQSPKPDEGTYFKRDWFWRFDPKEAQTLRKYQTADFAVTEAEDASDPDYTSIGTHGAAKTTDGLTRIYLCIDGWKGQASPERWVDEYFNLVKRHKPTKEFAEVGVIRRATEGLLRQKRRERSAIGVMEWMPHIGDKAANARALQGLAEMGLIGIANTEFGDEVLESLIRFPAGKHDDDVDMCALMGRVIDEAHGKMPEIPMQKPKRDRWDRAFDDDDGDNWKTA